jgi:hypothetical protein
MRKSVSGASSRASIGGSNRAGSFLERAHQTRANRLASGSSTTAPTRGQERLTQLSKFRSVGQAAKSAAHQGVVERPMDKQLSGILDRRRAELLRGGTSVARLGQENVTASVDAATPATSVADLNAEVLTEEQRAILPEEAVAEAIQDVNSKEEATTKGTSVNRLQTPKTVMGLKDPFHKPTRTNDASDMEI